MPNSNKSYEAVSYSEGKNAVDNGGETLVSVFEKESSKQDSFVLYSANA